LIITFNQSLLYMGEKFHNFFKTPFCRAKIHIDAIIISSCCAVGCTNRQKKPGIKLYRFLKCELRREKWIVAVKGTNGDLMNTLDYAVTIL
jgi:hypothetical protein